MWRARDHPAPQATTFLRYLMKPQSYRSSWFDSFLSLFKPRVFMYLLQYLTTCNFVAHQVDGNEVSRLKALNFFYHIRYWQKKVYSSHFSVCQGIFRIVISLHVCLLYNFIRKELQLKDIGLYFLNVETIFSFF